MAHKHSIKIEEKYRKGTVQYKEFIEVNVGDAELRISENDSERYAIYPVVLKTNSLSFAAPHTRVYRRYNDFLWLYRCLRKIPKTSTDCAVPTLPRKQLPFWNFEEDFLLKRRKSLEEFLASVIRETVFLSSTALHLFLQTDLPTSEMDDVIKRGDTEKALSENVKLLKVDRAFLNSLACPVPNNENCLIKTVQSVPSSLDGYFPVYWRCEKGTLQKVASLPHFSKVLRDYDEFSNNNTDSIQP